MKSFNIDTTLGSKKVKNLSAEELHKMLFEESLKNQEEPHSSDMGQAEISEMEKEWHMKIGQDSYFCLVNKNNWQNGLCLKQIYTYIYLQYICIYLYIYICT